MSFLALALGPIPLTGRVLEESVEFGAARWLGRLCAAAKLKAGYQEPTMAATSEASRPGRNE